MAYAGSVHPLPESNSEEGFAPVDLPLIKLVLQVLLALTSLLLILLVLLHKGRGGGLSDTERTIPFHDRKIRERNRPSRCAGQARAGIRARAR